MAQIKDRIYIDFETRSPVDLKKKGTINYAKNYYTEIMCTCIKIKENGKLSPTYYVPNSNLGTVEFINLLRDVYRGDKILVAHNIFFEMMIFKHVLMKYVRTDTDAQLISVLADSKYWIDTMGKARACGLPGSLEAVSMALKLDKQKDMMGSYVMKQLCAPKGYHQSGQPIYVEHPVYFEALVKYCKRDVDVTAIVDSLLPDLQPLEKDIEAMTIDINEYGIGVDTSLAKDCIKLSKQIADRLDNDFVYLTGFHTTQNEQIRHWVNDHSNCGPYNSVDKTTRRDILNDPNESQKIKDAISVKDAASKTSNKKYEGFLNAATPEQTVHNYLVFHRAITGRWASKGIQLQNTPRPEF